MAHNKTAKEQRLRTVERQHRVFIRPLVFGGGFLVTTEGDINVRSMYFSTIKEIELFFLERMVEQ